MYSKQVIAILDRREQDVAEGKPDKKPSRLNKAQKDTLKDLADEFLSEFGNEQELAARYQLFLLAASKVL